ncbi:hypothetical protein GCM10020358_75520 [Amorphoplanes nipponensis]|uniref:DUF4245 domain-containing protein n=1 Tax=Actinoplanes nipponensis TaxID=135950 RepID=A0A919JIV0_9ACTN|nr:DUF4245 domain-containing protein [Actinoplanes nipponensis]GIE50085.1 hypothetical protein Ani05nite_36190 [Actinoplanes nipponensis]
MTTPEAAPAPEAAAEPVTTGKRGGRSPRDMALSLGILLVPIALLLIFYRVVLNGDKPIGIDPAATIQQARSAAVFPVVVPQGLGDDWHAVSATFKRDTGGATLRLGWVDPDNDPVQLVESSVPTAELLPVELGDDPKAVSTFSDGARTWQRYDARDGENALILLEKGRTIIVVGLEGSENLETFAASLR